MKKSIVLIGILILFIVSSFVFSSAAVPTSRSLKSSSGNSAVQDLLGQGGIAAKDLRNEKELLEGRMDIETTDYSGAGANSHHDPKSPGTIMT